MNIVGLKQHLERISDNELLEIKDELTKVVHEDGSLLRVLIDKFGDKEQLFILQIQVLIWPLLEVISERLKSYNNQYIKNID